MLSGAARRCHVALPSTDLYRQGEPSSNYFVVIEGWVGTRVLLDDGS
jgi:CRP-like cAMP-binding protein